MTYKLGLRSRRRLAGVHPDLQAVVKEAILLTKVDFTVIEGVRTVSRQRELVRKGASKTMNSRHLTGHAVDLAPLIDGVIRWDWPVYYPMADAMKQAAKHLEVDLEWGGDWKTFKDGPHFQLSWKSYPKDHVVATVKVDDEISEEELNEIIRVEGKSNLRKLFTWLNPWRK